MSERDLLDYIIEIFPAEKPGCVSLSNFHNQMMNIVLPEYRRLTQTTELLQESSDSEPAS